jgi:REP element-mobilizing transposase RayT
VPEPAWAGFFSSHPDSKTIIAVKSEKFQRQYRIESTRAPWWDYGRNAAYYVTLCTRKRQCWFGDVVDQQMQLSGIGIIAEQCWSEIPDHFPFVELGEYVVMPNHVHGIIVIAKPDQERTPIDTPVETQNFASLQGYRAYRAYRAYQSESQPQPKNKFGPQSRNLGSIVRGFKIGVAKKSRHIHPEFSWQGRFHDHIIRSAEEYRRISQYIKNNPANWKGDRFIK